MNILVSCDIQSTLLRYHQCCLFLLKMIKRDLFFVLILQFLISSNECSENLKVFGGYKITPKYCRPTRKTETKSEVSNICMFNHECLSRKGMVVGACIDGFLFGACCQLPTGNVGDLLNSLDMKIDVTYKPVNNAVNKVTQTKKNHTDNSVISTAQSNEIFQIKDNLDTLRPSNLSHFPEPETEFLNNVNNKIDPNDFQIGTQDQMMDRSSTATIEDSTYSYGGLISPGVVNIGLSNSPFSSTAATQGYQRPLFRPKPTVVSPANDNYVLVPTISHSSRPNKTDELESIVKIIQFLNDTSTPMPFLNSSKPSTIYLQVTGTKSPTTVSYSSSSTTNAFVSSTKAKYPSSANTATTTPYGSTTRFKYPSSTNTATTISKATTKLNPSSKSPPSTSYVFSTTIPSRRKTTTSKKQPSSTTTKKTVYVKKPTYIYPPSSLQTGSYSVTTSMPTTIIKEPLQSSSSTIISTKTPSVSYVTGTTPPKRLPSMSTHVVGPSYSVISPTTASYSTPPTVILFSPIASEQPLEEQVEFTSTVKPKPVTHLTINNIVTANNNYHFNTSERPPNTVLITPKPLTNIITSNSYRPIVSITTEFTTAAEVEIETSADDLINFPPVRNPNLNISASLVNPDDNIDFTTPTFIEDQLLDKKVESFVNKIVLSLQEPFNELKDVIYDKNKTGFTTAATKPTTRKSTTAKPPIRISSTRPTAQKPTSKPITTRKPISKKPTTTKRTTVVTLPSTVKRTKPPRVTTTAAYDEDQYEDENVTQEQLDYKNHCGVRPLVKAGRIVGGKGATFGAWPWQVLVRESTWLGLFTKNKCGGVLISSRFVITAAHCQPGFLASLVAVFGEYDISADLEKKRHYSRNVKRVIVHRQYDAATFENDLALLELESPVDFDEHIVPICLPRGDEDFTGHMATVTGWGRLKYGGGVPSVLQEVKVPIMENHVCQEMFRTAGHSKIILDSFLCAGYANGQKDSCEGDSGGPLVLQRADGRWQLAGTVSHGIKCAAPYLPGVYMRTTYYKPWLESITGIH